jgi:hypothetical protein
MDKIVRATTNMAQEITLLAAEVAVVVPVVVPPFPPAVDPSSVYLLAV